MWLAAGADWSQQKCWKVRVVARLGMLLACHRWHGASDRRCLRWRGLFGGGLRLPVCAFGLAGFVAAAAGPLGIAARLALFRRTLGLLFAGRRWRGFGACNGGDICASDGLADQLLDGCDGFLVRRADD